ncbi:MAG: hypothetical protein Q9182_001815 [Xanthomendoza sp. 2 TL-2023]
MTDLNYFTCTLGQAVEINDKSPKEYETIPDFLHHQARNIPGAPAVAFPVPSGDNSGSEWSYDILIYDEAYAHVAQSSSEVADERFLTVPIPIRLAEKIGLNAGSGVSLKNDIVHAPEDGQPSASSVAFLFHSSGTSTGLPKPIPQSHRAAIGVLPSLSNGGEKATFTTTPLYHGGIADCLRAWTSGGLVWLFPGKDVPITPSNILKSLDCAKRAQETSTATSHKIPPIRYFSSVPYVLQMVSAEPEGMNMLQCMDIVGVGGAALPPTVGDSLVHQGVNLVSRFGSAECSFLLSSHRDYPNDKAWQYLRRYGSTLLEFEKQQDDTGLSELVIRPDWPHMAKRNREDGSFATADLFEPHPSIHDAWRYHSRADSQLTLITGKKFDPAPLEAAIASGEFLSDVLIFGNGMQSAGALLFRSDKGQTLDASQVLDETWPAIDQLNKEGQAHTRLSRSMLIVMDSRAPGLEKSSKGTILRAQAEKTYEREIRGAYEQNEIQASGIEKPDGLKVPEHEIPKTILETIKTVLGTNDSIPEEADLFSYGVDSVACMAIRAKLQSRILDSKAPALPLNVVYDCGNIKRLSRHLLDLRTGRQTESEDEIQLMKDLVTRYSRVVEQVEVLNKPNGVVEEKPIEQSRETEPQRDHVLLTGATGALGAHILHLLRSNPTVSDITCLVRAASPFAAHERVSKSLIARGKPGLPPYSASNPQSSQDKACSSAPEIKCIPTTLSHPDLGLDPSTYTHLARTTTLVIHAAWAVNFTARLRSFEKDHVAGLAHLLNLAHALPNHKPPKRFLFLSSTASVTNTPASNYPIAERISTDPTHASPLGYSRSKWVAENICANYYCHNTLPASEFNPRSASQKQPAHPNIAILRIGQLTSDTRSGIWNTAEAIPLMLSTAPTLHALPNLQNLPLDWLPVDIAAHAILDVAGSMHREEITSPPPVFHILNPSPTPTWSDLLSVIQTRTPGLRVNVLEPGEWLKRVEGYAGELPAKRLVGLWREAFSGEGKGKGKGKMVFGVERAKEGSAVMRGVGPLDEGFLGRMWGWVVGEVEGG